MGLFKSLGGVFGGLGEAVGGIAGAIGGYASTRATNTQNYRMFKEQLEYDKPINQVARLKEAGLNPNLVYGSGIQNMQTAGKQPEMKNPYDKVINGLQVSLLGSQVKKAKAEAKQAAADASLAGTNSVMAKLSAPYSLVRMQEDVVRQMLNNERFGFDNALLMKGVTPSFDRGSASQWLRVASQAWNWLKGNMDDGVTNTSRFPMTKNHARPNPSYGDYEGEHLLKNPRVFIPAGSWGFGSTYY